MGASAIIGRTARNQRRSKSNLPSMVQALAMVGLALLLGGCATRPRIDWNSRIGTYTYDQAVLEFGPPDKQAKLQDGTVVAEWLTRRGYTYAYGHPFAYGYYPWSYGPFYPSYIDTYSSPDYYLRLAFDPNGRLQAWKKFYK